MGSPGATIVAVKEQFLSAFYSKPLFYVLPFQSVEVRDYRQKNSLAGQHLLMIGRKLDMMENEKKKQKFVISFYTVGESFSRGLVLWSQEASGGVI